MTAESDIQSKILAFGRGAVRLFRVNTGQAWQPGNRNTERITWKGQAGVFLPHARPVKLPPPGSPDIAGIVSVVVTPEMVGQTVAVAVMIEVKGPRGRLTQLQAAALRQGQIMGCRAGMARSEDEANDIIWRRTK